MKKKLFTTALTAVFALGLIFPSFSAIDADSSVSVCSVIGNVLNEF